MTVIPERAGRQFILSLSCPDRRGIVHAVTGFLVANGCNILESQQFRDPVGERYFMRIQFAHGDGDELSLEALNNDFEHVATDYAINWRLVDAVTRARVVIMVSKYAHCLNDLLFRNSIGDLNIDVVAVVSNHPDLGRIADNYGVPFRHIPVNSANKSEAEAELLALVDEEDVDLVVLARYMQILSNDLCKQLEGRAINIHHSMLPSFKGARPYHQAHARGVKLIGATAHYVTADLDEGPIIAQEMIQADHSMDAEDLTARGREAEARALARAVRLHTENRILLNDMKTVVLQ